MTLQRSGHLTVGFDAATEALLAETHPGQAHWAGSGPDGKTCHGCAEHWGALRRWDPKANGGEGELVAQRPSYDPVTLALKPIPCHKRTRVMGSRGQPVPNNCAACRFFTENPSPPPLVKPVKAKKASKPPEPVPAWAVPTRCVRCGKPLNIKTGKCGNWKCRG